MVLHSKPLTKLSISILTKLSKAKLTVLIHDYIVKICEHKIWLIWRDKNSEYEGIRYLRENNAFK